MSKIRFKQWDDFLLTTVSKIGLYAGMAGSFMAVGLPFDMPYTFAALSLVPDTVVALLMVPVWKELEKEKDEDFHDHIVKVESGQKKDPEYVEITKITGNNILRLILDVFCARANIDPTTVEIYTMQNDGSKTFYAKGNKIFCREADICNLLIQDILDLSLQSDFSKGRAGCIIGHELSHIVVGDTKSEMNRFVDFLAHKLSSAFDGKMPISQRIGLFVAGSLLSVFNPVAGLTALAAAYIFPVYHKYSSLFMDRLKEYRADRNTLYLTENVDTAQAALESMRAFYQEDFYQSTKLASMLKTFKSTHPVGQVRVSALRRAFKKVCKQTKAELARTQKVSHPRHSL